MNFFRRATKALTDPVTLAPVPKFTMQGEPPRERKPEPELSKCMTLPGRVVQVLSASRFPDGKPRVEIRLKDEGGESTLLRLLNTEDMKAGDSLLVTIRTNNGAVCTQPLAASEPSTVRR